MPLLIDDIQEELRREDLQNRFKKALPWLGGLIVLILVLTAGYSMQKSRHQKHLIRYEALYAEAVENMGKKNWGNAKNQLETIAKNCTGLRFLALSTLSKMQQDGLLKKAGSMPAAQRSDLLNHDAEILGNYANLEFRQFLGLNRLFLDAQLKKGYFGPSPLGMVSPHSTSEPQPLSKDDLSNMFALYQGSTVWSTVAMAIPIMSMSRGIEQASAMQKWVQAFGMRFGPSYTIPLYSVMGLEAKI